MSIGGGIFLIVVGVILVYAVHVQVPGVSLDLIGWVLIGAGVVVTIIGIIATFRRRRSSVVTSTGYDSEGARVTRTDESVDEDDRPL